MGRVFEALERQQKRKKKGAERDPLAARTRAPEVASETGAPADFNLPDRIGAPVAPRSTEGAVLPLAADEQLNGSSPEVAWPPQSANVASPDGAPAASERPRQAGAVDPMIRNPQSAIRDPQSAIRNQYAPPQTVEPRVARAEPLDPARLHPRLILLTEPQSPGCEQYRTLRTQIFHAAQQRPAQVIVVTSAVAGEGKTSTALNLALAIAQSKEKRVLVMDSDLRRPNIATYLGLHSEIGMGEVLSGQCDATSAVVRLEDHGLYVLPVAREATNPSELLSSERLNEAIAELRQYFDFIIVDTPPVVPFADARLLAGCADAVMMVVRAGAAPYHTVERAIEALPAGRVLGVVLNGAEQAEEPGYYDYYYHDGKRGERQLFDWGKLGQKLGDWDWLNRRIGRHKNGPSRRPGKQR
jgi:capsular exopolysaccharide synthesis family protein